MALICCQAVTVAQGQIAWILRRRRAGCVKGEQLQPRQQGRGAAQRRYEALRAYFLDDMTAAEVADRFGCSTTSVHQMATLLRKGRLALFTEARAGPRGPRKATGELRARVLALRAAGHSVTEIAAALTAEGIPVSAQTAWQIPDAEGIPRLPRCRPRPRGCCGLRRAR